MIYASKKKLEVNIVFFLLIFLLPPSQQQQNRNVPPYSPKPAPEYLALRTCYWKLTKASFSGLPEVGHLEMFVKKGERFHALVVSLWSSDFSFPLWCFWQTIKITMRTCHTPKWILTSGIKRLGKKNALLSKSYLICLKSTMDTSCLYQTEIWSQLEVS